VSLFDEEFETDRSGDLCTADGLRRLQELPFVGPKTAVRLAERFSFWERLAATTHEQLLETLPRALHKRAQDILSAIPAVAEARAVPEGVRPIGVFDTEWPEWLRSIHDPPAVIYVRGTLPTGREIAVVGTRSPTRFGVRVVEAVAAESERHGSGIVSGLALGIDGVAHRSALANGVKTWAILGSGVDVPTPREHEDLASNILSAGGGLLSEQEPGTMPSGRTLVARNRLQAAAARTVVVAQCGIPSGTLHTARFAIQQGRRLVVPRPSGRWSNEKESAGNMALTDPSGCSPAVLQASGALNRAIARRKPVADLVIHDSSDVARIWE
jgi:DNA processing protein